MQLRRQLASHDPLATRQDLSQPGDCAKVKSFHFRTAQAILSARRVSWLCITEVT